MSGQDSHEVVEATMRRVPRYGVFMGIGIVLGVIVAALLTMVGSYEPSDATNVVYPPMQVFGFALLWTAPAGLALGGITAIVLERIARRHDRVVRVDHETIISSD